MTEQTLFSLLSDALWKGIYHADVPQAVLDEARMQAVDGLIQNLSYARIVSYVQYQYEESELVKLLNEKAIPFVILKGSSVALYYTIPAGRSFGDIDFIVPPDNFYETVQLLEENGYNKGADIGRHVAFNKDGIHFELHRRFSHEDTDIEHYVLEGITKRELGLIDEHEFPMLPPLANGLVLLDHMRSHLKSGMGLRQVIDWMMICDKKLDDTLWESCFRAAADKTGMTTLAVTTTALCQKYLGLKSDITWCSNADDSVVDMLMESLITSGNFGRKHGKGKQVETVVIAMKREGLFHYLQRAGEFNWEAYKKHKLLRPFCWIYQIFRYIKRSKGRLGAIKTDLDHGNERFELLEKLGI